MAFSFLSGAVKTTNTNFSANGFILPTELEKALGNPSIDGQVLASNTNGVRYWTSNISFAFTANSANFANNASHLDGKPQANLNVNSAVYSTNANFAYTANNASFLEGKPQANLNVNSAVYSTNANFAYTANNASHLDGKPQANLNVNSAVYSTNANFAYDANNSSHFDGKLPEYYTNANNISTGTLAEARLPFRMNQNVTSSSNVEFHNVVLTGSLSVANGVTVITANNFSITDNMIYFNNGILATITNVSGNGTYVTFTANNNFRTGWDVYVTGVDPVSWDGLYHNISFANATHFQVANTNTASYVSGGTARGKTDVNPDLGFAAGYNDGTYHHAGFFRHHLTGTWKVFDSYVPEPDASVYIDQDHPSFRIANFMANTIFVGNNTVFATITSTNFSGNANSATYAFGQSDASNLNVNSAIYSTNAQFAYNANLLNNKAESQLNVNRAVSAGSADNASNADNSTKLNTKNEGNLNVNAAVYSTNANFAYNANLLNNKSESALNVNSANSATYSNNANFLEGNPSSYFYQASNPSGFSNSTVGTAYNASNLNNQPASYYTNATNIITGTLQSNVIPSYVVNTSSAFTFTNTAVHTHNANVSLTSNAYLIFNSNSGIIANSSLGTNGQVLLSTGSGIYWSSSANSALYANNAEYLGGLHSSAYITTVPGTIENANNLNNQPGSYYTNATNITTGTLQSNVIPSYVVNTSGAFTISGTHTYNANLAFNANGALVFNANSKIYDSAGSRGSSGQVLSIDAFNNISWSTVSGVSQSDANNANYLGNNAPSFYTNATNINTGTLAYAQLGPNVVNTTANFAIGGIFTYSSNIVIGSTGALVFNSGSKLFDTTGSQGSAGQVLASNGAGNVYWTSMALLANNENFINTTASYTFTNTATHTHNANIVLNANAYLVVKYGAGIVDSSGGLGSTSQILTSNGTNGVYWSTFTGGLLAANGLSSNSTHMYVNANSGLVANTSGLFINTAVVATLTDTQTLTNKRITQRVNTQVISVATTITPDISLYSEYNFTSMANSVTIAIPTGAPVPGDKLLFRFNDNGVAARPIFFTVGSNGAFRAVGSVIPANTSLSKTTYVGCLWNSFANRWDVVTVIVEV